MPAEPKADAEITALKTAQDAIGGKFAQVLAKSISGLADTISEVHVHAGEQGNGYTVYLRRTDTNGVDWIKAEGKGPHSHTFDWRVAE